MPVVKPHRGYGIENQRSEASVRDLAQVLEQSGEAVIVKDLNAVEVSRRADRELRLNAGDCIPGWLAH